MSAQDQLEIINAQGDVRFYSLNTGAGITNIGRHPDNDIVIESPEVAPFHAVLDHQQKPYRIVALSSESRIKVSGQILQLNAPRELHNWDTIELDGYSIILLESGAAVPGAAPSIAPSPAPTPLPAVIPVEPVPAAASFGAAATVPSPDAPIEIHNLDELDRLLASIPEDRVDDLIMVEPIAQMNAMDPAHPNALDFSVEVDQSATLQVTIVNGGDLVSEFLVEVRGIDPGWVAILPRSINLNDGDRGTVSIAITPPRLSSTRAKAHYFAIVVTSPSYPGRMSSTTGMLVVRPFYEYAVGDIDPKKLKVSWSKRVGQAAIPIANQGNSDAPFQLSGEDDRHAANIEFDSPEEGLKLAGQIQFHVPPEQTIAIPIFITPRKRPIVGVGGQDINYTVTVTPLAGETQTPRTVLGQARSLPLIGPLPIVLLVILFALLVILIFRPWIAEFKPDVKEIESGQSVTLSWRASPLASLRIEPDVGKVEGPEGGVALSPLDDVTYTLKAETFLTRLLPQWFTAAADVRIAVDPVLPEVEFRVDRDSILSGEKVVLSWEVQAQQPAQVILTVNGAPETILPDEYIGSRPFVLERDTTFTLKVSNRYTPPEGQTASLVVKVTVPSPTPRPLPVIERFDVTPLEITAGESVTVSWAVSGADKVKIEGIGELPPSGSISAKPAASIAYVLTASNGQQEVSSLVKQVIVNPVPTPTPLPETPRIEFFIASPAEVAIGSPESKNIDLSWSITGDTTNVEINSPTFGKSSGLPKKGNIKVSTDKQTLFILTAFNGTLSSSATVQIKVKNPAPKITSISPSTSVDVGGSGFVLVVTGSGFTKDSKVRWEGSNRATTVVSDTQLNASILPDDLAKAGTFNISVFNPTPGGGASNSVVFTLNNPVPTISSIDPISVVKGSQTKILTVNGTNFVNGASVVRFGGVDMATTFVSSTQLTAVIPGGQLGTEGTPAVTVVNPTPGGGTSNSITFTIFASNPKPKVNALSDPTPGLSPSTATVGGAGFVLTVNGSDFVTGARVRWNGILLDPLTLGSTQITVSIPSTNLSNATTANIAVVNPTPGGGASTPTVPLTVGYPTVTLTPVSPITLSVSANVAMTATISGGAQAAARTITLGANSSAVRITANCASSTAVTSVNTTGPNFNTATFCVMGQSQTSSATVTAGLPATLGGDTDAATFTVNNPTPTIDTLNPPSAVAGGPGFDLLVSNTDNSYVPGSVVRWGATNLTTTFVSSTQLRAFVPNTLIATSGTANITVFNPPPPGTGSTSAPLVFNIQNTLTVTVNPIGSGASGTVTSNVGGINCPGTCSVNYNDGSTVTLTATAGANSVFTGWSVTSGTCTGTTSPCTVTMSAARTVTADFTASYVLNVTASLVGGGTGTVTSNVGGISCPGTCSANYNNGTSVTLTANPTGGSVFSGWTGDCSGTGSCVLTMNSAKNVTATFTGQNTLTVTVAGTGSGSVTSNVGGINCPGTCSANYSTGVNVQLTAAASAGSVFIGWSGGGCSGTGTCTVTMNSAQAVTATFGHSLTVNRTGTGVGTVTSTPAGINCGVTCTANFSTSVDLTPAASAGSVFIGWSGCTSVAGTTCTVSMTSNTTVTATFGHTLTVNKVGTGSGTVTSNPAGINCGATCTANFSTSVDLTPAASGGSVFIGWSGCTSVVGTTCTVSMTSNTTVTATFGHMLTVTIAGLASDSVASTPAGISCPGTCTANFSASVDLTPTAGAGSVFGSWSGCTSVAGTTCTVNMASNTTVTATFAHPLTVNVTTSGTGTGNVTSSPGIINCPGTCSQNFNNGTSVTLTATATSGAGTTWTWSGGGCSGGGPTCNVTVNGPVTVTVNFNQ